MEYASGWRWAWLAWLCWRWLRRHGGHSSGLCCHDPSVEHACRIFAATTVRLPLVIVSLMILHTLVPVPAEVLAVAAGMMLGPLRGFVTIWIGAMLGAYLGFFLARTFGPPLLRRLVAPQRLERVQRWFEPMDIPILLAVRLVPVLSFNMLNFALGLTRIPWWRFTWTTGVGIVPVTVLVVVFGAHLENWRVLILMTLAALVVCLGGSVVLHWRSGAFPPWRVSRQAAAKDGQRSH